MLILILLIFSVSNAQISKVANLLYGQSSFTNSVPAVPPTASSLYQTTGIVMDSLGNLYVSDQNGNRVLRFPPGSTTADLVYGQADFSSSSANRGGSVAANTLSNPNGLAVDSDNRLYVCDALNNRVLAYNFGQTTPSIVYGQADFTSDRPNRGGSISGLGLFLPLSVTVDPQDRLYIMDAINYRILRFPKTTTVPDEVYNQPNFVTVNVPSSPNKNNFGAASQIHYDAQGYIWIADGTFNRVLRYSPVMRTSVFVYGQPGYITSTLSSTSGVNGNSLEGTGGVFTLGSASNLQVFISDFGNNRILYYENLSTTPSAVFGQSSTTANIINSGGRSASSLYAPANLYGTTNGGVKLFVCDKSNLRVLGYTNVVSTTTTGGSPPFTTSPTNSSFPPSGGGDNVCFHKDTILKFSAKSRNFTLKYLQNFPDEFPDCRVVHTVQSKGVELVFEEGYTLAVTQNHLIAHKMGISDAILFIKAKEITSKHLVICSSPKGYCTLKKIVWIENIDTYFGLNCINSMVYANDILASTFENLHHIPALWMRVVGNIFGIKRASVWGDTIAEWAYKNNLI